MVEPHRIHHDGGLWWYVAHFTLTDNGYTCQVWEYTDVDDDVTGEGHFVHKDLAHTRLGDGTQVPGQVTSRNYRSKFTRHLTKRGWTIRQGSQPVYSPRAGRYEVALALPQIIPTTHHRTNGLAYRVAARVGGIVDAHRLGIQLTVRDPDEVARDWTTTTINHHDGASTERTPHHGKEVRQPLR